MKEYQVLARQYRPQNFKEVVGQEPIVQTLKNAIRLKRISHAYLLCGPRGTGKTTIVRVLAKAINCDNLTADYEPCNQCPSCQEITSGVSLNVLEIDGASNRGIDDVRQINETVGYATSSGKYKIYIIDEVHMLTKEAFNALLKTLEEPPEKVKFFLATTEPHKVLPTILSRCQRFNLSRISQQEIFKKLNRIVEDLKVDISSEALHTIAKAADGAFRDAESILDQIITFGDKKITNETVDEILGSIAFEQLFALDAAVLQGNLCYAFELSHQLFKSGKDIMYCLDNFIDHYRSILLMHLAGPDSPLLSIPELYRPSYRKATEIYTLPECLSLLSFLVESQNHFRAMPSKQIVLESTLLHIINVKRQIPVEHILTELSKLKEQLGASKGSVAFNLPASGTMQPLPLRTSSVESRERTSEAPPALLQTTKEKDPLEPSSNSPQSTFPNSPAKRDATSSEAASLKSETMFSLNDQTRYDSLLQFTAIELEGKIKNKKATTR